MSFAFSYFAVTRAYFTDEYRLIDVNRNVHPEELLSHCVVHACLICVSPNWWIVLRMDDPLSKEDRQKFLWSAVEVRSLNQESCVVSVEF